MCGPSAVEVSSPRCPNLSVLHAHLREPPRGTADAEASLRMIPISFSLAQTFLLRCPIQLPLDTSVWMTSSNAVLCGSQLVVGIRSTPQHEQGATVQASSQHRLTALSSTSPLASDHPAILAALITPARLFGFVLQLRWMPIPPFLLPFQPDSGFRSQFPCP